MIFLDFFLFFSIVDYREKRRLEHMIKKRFVLGIIIGMIFISSLALAQDRGQKGENKVIGFFKNIFLWPVNIVKRGGEAALDTTKEGAEGVAKTGKALSDVVTGDVQKVDDAFMEPVKGTAKTGVTAVEGAVKAPVEGTKETWSEK
jgi:hypothetical protein